MLEGTIGLVDDEPYVLRVFPEGEELARLRMGPSRSFVGRKEEVEVDEEYGEYKFCRTVTFV